MGKVRIILEDGTDYVVENVAVAHVVEGEVAWRVPETENAEGDNDEDTTKEFHDICTAT